MAKSIPRPPQIQSTHAANIGYQKRLDALYQHAKAEEWEKVAKYPTPGQNTYARMVVRYKIALIHALVARKGSHG